MKTAAGCNPDAVRFSLRQVRESSHASSSNLNWRNQMDAWQVKSGPVFLWSCPARTQTDQAWHVTVPTYGAHFCLSHETSKDERHIWVGAASAFGGGTGVLIGMSDHWATGTMHRGEAARQLNEIKSVLSPEVQSHQLDYLIRRSSQGFGALDSSWAGAGPTGRPLTSSQPLDLDEISSWIDNKIVDPRLALGRALTGLSMRVDAPQDMLLGMVAEASAVFGPQR